MENEKNLEPNLTNEELKKETIEQNSQPQTEDKNLALYILGREVPEEAKKTIEGGKLKGFTDINPMWRIKKLTEMFGPCGQGWKVLIVDKWVEAGAYGEIIANVKINLLYKNKDTEQWSEPIEGVGGSMLIATEQGKLRSNDEAFKMAYTDAISVVCKMLGIGADVYYEADRTKYNFEGDNTTPQSKKPNAPKAQPKAQPKNQSKYQIVKDLIKDTSIKFSDVEDWLKQKAGTNRVNNVSDDLFNEMIKSIKARIAKEKETSNQTPWDEE